MSSNYASAGRSKFDYSDPKARRIRRRKRNKKKKKAKRIIAVVLVVAIAFGAISFFRIGEKFKDVTVEAGTQQVRIDDFLNKGLYKPFSKIISGISDVDLNKAGDYPLRMSMAGKEEDVTLHVVDTTAPKVEFNDVTKFVGYKPDVNDFVSSVEDYSETTVEFASELPSTKQYSTNTVTVVVRDAYGNETSKDCTLVISWLKSEAEVQIGNAEFAKELVADPEKDIEKIPETALAAVDITKLGDYALNVDYEGSTFVCNVKVIDTTPPELKLKDISVYHDDTKKFKMEDFIESATDNSGVVVTTMTTELKFSGTGTQVVTIKAEDPSGNVTEANANYIRKKDTDPPKFTGITKMTVKKNSKPDYNKGVSAKDEHDGNVSFTYNADAVDLTKAGTYYVVYTAKDNSGNTATTKRQVVVDHDASDTKALVQEMAKQCGNSVAEIRAFVRKIKYASTGNVEDPVWYGFTNWSGGCYVHAYCYKALLEAKGYTTQIIWTTNKSHYWNLIYTTHNGVTQWWHSDTTPTSYHTPLPVLATDAQRYKHLQGRDWDRNKWPACP